MPPVGFEPTILAGKRPAAAHLLKSWVRIPPGTWIFVCCECRVLLGRSLCDELITRPEESYRLWCVVVCDLETSRIGAPYIYDISNLRVKVYCLRNVSTSITFNNCIFCPHCIYVFCIYLRTNSDLCHLHHKLTGFYNRDEKCLQRGTDWVFN